ncbi:MAG: hypothetical protein AAFV96_10350, partial [Pseudomonadota bacterium]
MPRYWPLLVLALGLGGPVAAEDKALSLGAPEALREAGLLQYLLPRFSLKTQVRVTLGASGEVELRDAAAPGFRRMFHEEGGAVWYLSDPGEDADAVRFHDWLASEVGQRAVASFGDGVFSGSYAAATAVEVVRDGDAVAGEALSMKLCGRCHVVGEANRMAGLGSSPSFGALRALGDWEGRFEAFYAL